MSQADEVVRPPGPGREVEPYRPGGGDLGWADLRPAAGWARRHQVVLAGLALIALTVAWKAQFLGHLYFRQDDYHDLDLAVDHPFSWSYLTYIGSGHLIIGLRAIAWVLVRTAGTYNWGAASAVTLAFVALAGIAALRLLLDLLGERPAILVPLAVYLLTPLTLPDIGIWSSAMESVPLQLATFGALSAHLRHVRTGRARHLAGAALWVAFGLAFFEKGLVLPPLLFAFTAGFLAGEPRLPAAAAASLRRHWPAWSAYAAEMIAYAVLLARALHTSESHPHAPRSASGVLAFAWGLLRESFLPGALGGPWRWLPTADASYSFAAPPGGLILLAVVVAAAVVGVSIRRRPVAWRAWAMLAGWILLADMAPAVIGRIYALSPAVLALETRYVADAAPVLALSLGLAFWPLAASAGPAPETVARPAARPPGRGPLAQRAAAIVVGLFAFGSVWSVQAYENVTTGAPSARYIANAIAAVRLAPRGTPVFNVGVPGYLVEGLFGAYAMESKVIGDIAPGRLRWIRDISGTIDGLRMFGADGRLYPAYVQGAASRPLAPGLRCWPARRGRITVPFRRPSPATTGMLRIGYLWYSRVPAVVTVYYRGLARSFTAEPGLHSGYVPVSGGAAGIVVGAPAGFCVGDAEAGNLRPDPLGPALPPPSRGAPPAR